MSDLSLILSGIIIFVLVEHFLFFVLEFFYWTHPLGLKVFKNDFRRAQETKVLAANQGVYNLFLSLGLFWSLIQTNEDFSFQIKFFFLTCVFIAGVYGAFSFSKKIWWVQGFPAMIGLVTLSKIYFT